MDPRVSIAEQILGEALRLPPEHRASYLSGACRGDAKLQATVEQLLAENEAPTAILPDPQTKNLDLTATISQPGPGDRLADRYCIESILGAGGMGVVYRARDEKLDRTVAIKILRPGMLTDDGRMRFRREARALAKLNHPRIAALYDVVEEQGVNLIVMEFVEGEPLSARLKAGPVDAREATAIALHVTEALEEAGEQGVIHRDLKPANVMMTPKGEIKVLDFGLAKLLGPAELTQSLTQIEGVMGTPSYMSPEQAQGKPVDERTDLWSLGVLYYELLAGQVPFRGDTNLAVLQAVIRDPAEPVGAVRPGTPRMAERIVARALEKDRENRYATAAEMASDLSGLLATMSGTISIGEAVRRTRPLKMLAAGLALILLVAAAGGWWFYRNMAERRWAREEAVPTIARLMESRLTVEALAVLQRAERDLPGDPQLRKLANQDTRMVTVTSNPPGATISLQDYLAPAGPVLPLGTTPLSKVRIPAGYFRWTVAKAGERTIVAAPETTTTMRFDLTREKTAPRGMVYVAGGDWTIFNGFIGWIGPYRFPPYYIDQYEVTNRAYQEFVNHGGYEKPEYWPATFIRDGKQISWSEAMAEFRDSTGRPGPSSWAAGHYPDGRADDPVSGVSWFEAAAYAKFAGRDLPVLGQWYQAADFDISPYTAQLSNLTGNGLAKVGKYSGLGKYGI